MHPMLPPALGDLLKQRYVLPHVDLHFSMIMLTCYFFVLNKLWTLCTFWLSFGGLGPLFSSFYELFAQQTPRARVPNAFEIRCAQKGESII